MVPRQAKVYLGQKGAGVVCTIDGTIVAIQCPFEPRVHKGSQSGVHACRVALPGVSQHLLVVRGEEERLVPLQGTAEREPELSLPEAGPAFRAVVPRDFGERVVLAEEVRRSAQRVRARFGDDVDEAAAGATEFRVGALGDDDDFRNGVQIEGEGRALTPALLAEKRVVEIRAVHRDVVVDAALPADREFVSIGTLDDAHAGGQEREVEEVAPVVGQVLHGVLRQAGGCLGPRNVHGRPSGHDDELLHFNNHLDDQINGLSYPYLYSGLSDF